LISPDENPNNYKNKTTVLLAWERRRVWVGWGVEWEWREKEEAKARV